MPTSTPRQPGCASSGADRDAALDAFPAALGDWLLFLEEQGEAVPSPETELEIAVDEWLVTESELTEGTSRAFFEADLPVVGHVEFVTSTIFDVGVYLVVIGLVLDVLRSLGAEVDRQTIELRARTVSAR